MDWNKVVFSGEVNCFDCPSCKKTILYSCDDNWNYCPECDKRFTQEQIDNCEEEEKPKIKFNVKKKKIKVQWSEAFCDDMTDGRCYFCNKENDNDWDASCEDAVCITCHEKWKYNEDEDCYYSL